MSRSQPLGPPLRAAVIGCGAIAYSHLPFLAQSPHARLVAVCDHSAALAEAAAMRFGGPRTFSDPQVMFESERPDIVHVLTPPHTHAELVRLVLNCGSHVVCEKPLAATADETALLLGSAQKAGRLLVESRNLLFNDAIIAIRRMICAGELGTVRECDISINLDFLSGPFGDANLEGPAVALPGGVVHDFLPHLAYLFLALGGNSHIDSVAGILENSSGNPRAGFDLLDARLATEAVRGHLRIAPDLAPDSFRVIVRGSQASVETDLYQPYLRYEGAWHAGKRAPFGQVRSGLMFIRSGLSNLRNKIRQHGTMHGLPRMLDAVYFALRQGSECPIAGADMLATARLVDRIVALGTPR